jgi:hypothetical protein
MVKEPAFPCCLSVEIGSRLADRTGQLRKNETDTDEQLLMAPSRSQSTARRRSRELLAQNFDHQHPGAVDDRDEARDIACSDPKKPGWRPCKKQRTPPDDEGQSEAHAHDGPHQAFGRGRVLTRALRARLNYNRRHDHHKPHHDDFGTQKRRRLLGDENEARRGDGADWSDQRLAARAGTHE